MQKSDLLRMKENSQTDWKYVVPKSCNAKKRSIADESEIYQTIIISKIRCNAKKRSIADESKHDISIDDEEDSCNTKKQSIVDEKSYCLDFSFFFYHLLQYEKMIDCG